MQSEIKKFKDAARGVYLFMKSGVHEVSHLITTIIIIIAGFYFDINKIEWIAILLCIALVLITEAANTAIEKLCDFVHAEKNNKIRDIKDISSGAVLIAAIISAIIGSIIFIPKIF